MEFVNSMRKKGELIMGIGHRVKSINNPDMRVIIIKVNSDSESNIFDNQPLLRANLLVQWTCHLNHQEFLRENFPATPLLDYALEVEKITTSKKPNLILNVDGIIGVAFVDLLRHSGCFTRWVDVYLLFYCQSL